MSMSSPQGGGTRKPGTVRVGGASTSTAKSPGAKPSDGTRPSSGSSRTGSRPPVMRVAKQRNWTSIIIISVVAVIALGIIGYGAYQVHENSIPWNQKADGISGIVDYRKTDPASLTRNHVWGNVDYKYSPPVGGNHNYNWQRCAGDVYPAAIANENAVHSLEHGAVWITYNPDLPAAQVAALAAKVQGNDYMLMSPYPGLTSPISLQAWGYQLHVNSASDSRINDFIKDLRINATEEAGVDCSSGTYVTATGTTAHDVGKPADAGSPAPSGSPSAPAPSPSKS